MNGLSKLSFLTFNGGFGGGNKPYAKMRGLQKYSTCAY